MVTRPTVHATSTTVGQLRAFFADDHVHIALLVQGDELVGTVERGDITCEVDDATPAARIAKLDGRTIDARATEADALTTMRRGGRRRLAVTDGDARLLGLLCLKASGRGFCSDDDVGARGRRSTAERPE
jgi:predicted transcriptional regulator